MTFGGRAICDMADARVRNRGLAIEHEADGLNGLDRERLMSFDQRTVVRQVMNADGVTGVETAPERSEHLKSYPGAAVAR